MFHDSCPGPAVILGDFAAGLTAAVLKKKGMTASESGIELAWKVEQEMDASGTDCMLQLCDACS